MKILAFFNNKGGVGKTSLVYHLSWMFAEKGLKVLAVDLDPQSNLTSMFIPPEDRLEELPLWGEDPVNTISDSFKSLEHTGAITPPHLSKFYNDNIALLPGDLDLSTFEDLLTNAWTGCMSGDPREFRVESAFYRLIQEANKEFPADIVLLDIGSNLGAINRAALICTDYVAFPLALDLFTAQSIQHSGSALKKWRTEWHNEILPQQPADLDTPMPSGDMLPIGYIVMKYGIKEIRKEEHISSWIEEGLCTSYTKYVSQGNTANSTNKLAQLKHYRSLMPLAQEARKPAFSLKSKDGAIGAHLNAVKACYDDFSDLADALANRMNLMYPEQ